MTDNASPTKSRLEILQILVGILLALAAGYSAWQMNAAEKSLKETEKDLKNRESARKDSEETRVNRESIEKKQLLVYDAVVKSLESGDAKKQKVSKALVTSMLEDPLRTELLNVLTESGSPEIKRDAQATLTLESTFKTEEGLISSPKATTVSKSNVATSRWGDLDIDIFWCERSGNTAKDQAEKLKQALLNDGAKGRLRVRLLPDSINARPGYQHSGYIIRYNKGEETQSELLKTVGDKTIHPRAAFIQTISHQPTPWYLSAFICP